MAAALDSGYVAAACSLPESTITTLLDAPTVDLVRSLLLSVQQKAQEFDLVNSEKLQLEVELETVVRSTEARSQHTKESSEKSLKDVEDLRRKVSQEETARVTVENELHTLKSTSASHKAEVENLQNRISSLEASKREALALADSKATSQTKLVDDLAAQQQKVNALRRELTELEDRRQAAENAASTSKFREQALEQEVEALKKHNEWLDEELNRRTAEHAKFRKEKNARVAELQRLYEDATQNVEALQRTETSLRSRQEELNQKVEDNIARIQTLQEEAIRSQESHKQELDTVRRLSELQQQAAEEARARVQDLQRRIEQLNDDAAEEIGQLQAELENAHQHREEADAKIAELEMQIERLQAEVSAPRRNVSVPSTPRRGVNGLAAHTTPLRGTSPGLMATPGSRAVDYTNNQQSKARIESEQRRNQRLTATIEEMVREIEAKKPELDELRLQYDHAAAEIARLSQEVETAQVDREKTRKEARKWEGQAAGAEKEALLLRQQIRDISLQLKILLVEQQAQAEGLDPLGQSQILQLERIIQNEVGDEALQGMSESSRYISQQLTIFRNVDDLVKQNSKLLSLTRRLTEDMEGEEARSKKDQQEREREELQHLRENISNVEQELKMVESRCETFKRERDMFSQLLARRGNDTISVAGRESMMSPNGSRAHSVDRDAISEQSRILRELQNSYDAYRQEASTDRAALKQQAERLGKDKNELQGELAQIRSQLGMAQERYDLLLSNYNMLKSEQVELQKRAQSHNELAAKQDARTQQTMDELVDARGLVNGLRSEIASLKAEREIWKRMETRIGEDNKSLIEERSRLNKSLADLQKLQNDRELRDAEARKEVLDRASGLESELHLLRQAMDTEKESAKQTALRNTYDQEQQRARIDDLMKGLGNIKEDLVKVQTERDQAQARVSELRQDLRTAEQKLVVVQARPVVRPAVTDENAPVNTGSTDAAEQAESLQSEIDNLREELQHRERLLSIAKESEDRNKAISDAAEDQIASLNETYEQYRGETETLLRGKDDRIAELETRLEQVTTDLTKTTQELSQLQLTQGEAAAKFKEDKDQIEAQLIRLRDENERLSETTQMHREDLKAQAEIAQQAQQSYEDELIKHSEAAKVLQKVRFDYNQLKTEVSGVKNEAETAKDSLEKSEESWAEQRRLFEKEINDHRIRRADAIEQNQLLHKQLEDFSKQLEDLKRTKDTGAAESSTAFASNSDNYQEIVRHMKREKEIVDMQYDISSRDCKRLQHQLDQTQSQLDQTREKLATEMRNQAESERIRMDRDKLEQSINELNVFRESNGVLRVENQKAAVRITSLEQEVAEVRNQLQPLREHALTLENQIALKDGEYKLLTENRDFWEKRSQDIMSKHNRADPAELEELKRQLAEAHAEKERLVEEKKPLQEQVDGFPEKIRAETEELSKNFEERKAKIIENSKSKVRELSQTIKEQRATMDQSAAETQRLQQDLSRVQAELAAAVAVRDTSEAVVQQNKDTEMTTEAEEGQVQEHIDQDGAVASQVTELEAKLREGEQKLSEELARAQQAGATVQALQDRIKVLETTVVELQQQLSQSATQETVSKPGQGPVAPPENTGNDEAEIAKVREELAAARSEIETLRVNAAATQSTTPTSAAIDGGAGNDAQIQQRVEELRKQLQEDHDAKVKASEERFKARADNMKQQLTTKLKEGRAKYQEEIKTEQQQQIDTLQAEHSAEIERWKSELQSTQSALNRASATSTPAQSIPAAGQPIKAETEPQKVDLANLTQDQVKEFMGNETIKGIVARNIAQKMQSEREKLQEEKQKAIDQAREMESKRSTLKLNIADNKARNSQAKIDVVQQAAKDTPQRPVVEVWEIAKDAKAAAAAAKPATANSQTKPPTPGQALASAPNSAAQPSAAGVANPAPAQPGSAPGQTPMSAVNPFAQGQQQQNPAAGQQAFGQPGFGRGIPGGRGQVANPFASQAAQTANPFAAAQSQQPNPSTPQLQPPQANAGLPPRPSGPPAGTGPGALRNLMGQQQQTGQQPQSGIPRGGTAGASRGGRGGFGQPAGLANQQQAQASAVAADSSAQPQQGQGQQANAAGRGGSQLPRGGNRGGRGGGRGGIPQPGQQLGGGGRGRGSPRGGANMNPVAQQFVPGGPNKRVAEGSPGGESAEKKPKG